MGRGRQKVFEDITAANFPREQQTAEKNRKNETVGTGWEHHLHTENQTHPDSPHLGKACPRKGAYGACGDGGL